MNPDLTAVKKARLDITSWFEASTAQTIAESEKIQNLHTAPPSREDVCAFLAAQFEQRTLEYAAAFDFNIQRLVDHPMTMGRVHGVRIVTAAPAGVESTLWNAEVAITALLGEAILAAAKQRIMAMAWPDNVGPPVAERAALLEIAEKKLAELNKQRTELRQQAADAGINI